MRTQWLLIGACLMAAWNGWAERVDESHARQVAEQVVARQAGSLRQSKSLSLAYVAETLDKSLRSSEAASADYYVYNVGQNEGFVIVSGEDRAMPVLGYADSGAFDAKELPDAMKSWLTGCQEQIQWASQQKGEVSLTIRKAWKDCVSGTLRAGGKSKLLKTANWNQNTPYNLQTPTYNGQHAFTGCIPTAVAILMQYYQYPKQADPANRVADYEGRSIHYTSSYDWSQMPAEIDANNANQTAAISQLMWEIGANMGTQYGLEESSTSMSLAPLMEVFGFSRQMKMLYKEDWGYNRNDAEWEQLIRTELEENRPVFYSASSDTKITALGGVGHAFIIDGYDSYDFYHVNWGWGGHCNGYFLLTALDPYWGENYKGGYNHGASIISHFMPNNEQDNQALPQLYECPQTEGFAYSSGMHYYEGSVTFPIINSGNASFKGWFAMAMTDRSGNIQQIIDESIGEAAMYEEGYGDSYYWKSWPFRIQEDEYIAVAYSLDKTHWEVVKGSTSDMAYMIGVNGVVSNATQYFHWEIGGYSAGFTLDAPKLLAGGGELRTKIKALPGYDLPTELSIQVGYQTLSVNPGSDWLEMLNNYATYNPSTGDLVIKKLTGHLTLSGYAEQNGTVDLDRLSDASLATLAYTMDGKREEITVQERWRSYFIGLPEGSNQPQIQLEAIAKRSGAKVSIQDPVWFGEKAYGKVTVTSENGEVTEVYTIVALHKDKIEDPSQPEDPDQPITPDQPSDTEEITGDTWYSNQEFKVIHVGPNDRYLTPRFTNIKTELLQIEPGANICISLNESNSLGAITNNGELTFVNNLCEGSTTYTQVINNGKLLDVTGFFHTVEGPAAVSIEPLKVIPHSNGEVEVATRYQASDGGSLQLTWYLAEGQGRTPISQNTLRSTEASVGLMVVDPGIYQFEVEHAVGDVSTTIGLYVEVKASDFATANEQIERVATQVWTDGGSLWIELAKDEEVQIYSVAGQLVHHEVYAAGSHQIELPTGIYFIKIDQQTWKLRL